MATSASTLEQILDWIGDDLETLPKKMFGEYGLFVDGKMAAMVCDDILFVKPTPDGLALLGEHETAAPYPGAKPLPIVEDSFSRRPGKLAELLRLTARGLPAPKAKAAPKKRAK
jgi:DNA transformation protein and related proteins